MEILSILAEYIDVLLSSLLSALVSIAIFKYGIKTERRFSIYETHLSTISKTLQQDRSKENLKILADLESSIPSKYVSKKLRKSLNGLIASYSVLLKKDLYFLDADSELLVKNFIEILINKGLVGKEFVIDESNEDIQAFIDELAAALKKYAYHYLEDEKNFLKTIFEYLCENSNRLFNVSITGSISDLYENTFISFSPSGKYRTVDELLTRKYYAEDINRLNIYQQRLIKEIEKYY